MTTQRLNILAAAAALREFTAPELTAYTGANANTVRQVLRRSRDLFEQDKTRRDSEKGRQAVLWRLKDTNAVFKEIASEESKITELRASTGSNVEHSGAGSGSVNRTEALLASAEDAAAQSYEVSDPAEQKAFADIAINFLHAADPNPDTTDAETSRLGWWERRPDIGQDQGHSWMTSLSGISAGTIDSRRGSLDLSQELLHQRARRVAAFASLAARRAEGLPIETEHLYRAAEAIAAGTELLPPDETAAWMRRIVNASISTGGRPPIAVLTPTGQSPSDLFPVIRGRWQRIGAPVDFARLRYARWVEDWAAPLSATGLMPGTVMSHNDTPESNKMLNEVLEDPEHSSHGPAMVVASTSEDFQVVARVSLSGGTFYPIHGNMREGLLQAVTVAVERAVGAGSNPLFSWPAGHGLSVGRGYRLGHRVTAEALINERTSENRTPQGS